MSPSCSSKKNTSTPCVRSLVGQAVYDRALREPRARRPMSEPRIDVVHVGSASRDLTDEDPRGWRLGGGVSYCALTTARLGLRTAAIVGVDRGRRRRVRARPAPRGRRRRSPRRARRGSGLPQPRDAHRPRPGLAIARPATARAKAATGLARGARPGRSFPSPPSSTRPGHRSCRRRPSCALAGRASCASRVRTC